MKKNLKTQTPHPTRRGYDSNMQILDNPEKTAAWHALWERKWALRWVRIGNKLFPKGIDTSAGT